MGERVQNEGIDGTIGTGDIKEPTTISPMRMAA